MLRIDVDEHSTVALADKIRRRRSALAPDAARRTWAAESSLRQAGWDDAGIST